MTPERAGEEVPRQVPGTDKGEALDQLLVSDDVATDLLPYQVEEDARLSQGRGPRFLIYLTLRCIMLLCILGFEFIRDARNHGDQQGLDSRFLDPDRPGDPGRRGQLRLRHPQASSGAVRRAYGVDGRDALPRSASARAARPRRSAVGSCGEWPPSQVLPDHVPRPGSARRGTQAVAGGGRDAAGHLAGTLPSRPGRPPNFSRATSTGGLSDADSG